MNAKTIIAQLLAQRETRVEVEPGKVIVVRRPPAADMPKLKDGVTVPLLVEFTAGWEGITEADILGAAVGSSDALPFDGELWSHVVADREVWFDKCAAALIDAVAAHLRARRETAGNSQPSSN